MLHYSLYRLLRQNEQLDLLLEDGVYLHLTRHTQISYIELYALGNFYVEVYFDKLTEEPLLLRPFCDLRHLDPYLKEISIAQILPHQ